MREYSNDAYILENYILDKDFDSPGKPANPSNGFKMLIKEIETSLSVPVKSGCAEAPDRKEVKARVKEFRAQDGKRTLNVRLWREKKGVCIIAPLDDGLTPLELAFHRLGRRMTENKLCYMLDGKPCNTPDILRAAGIEEKSCQENYPRLL